MRIIREIGIALAVMKQAVSSFARWYVLARRNVLIARALNTVEGREKLAEAMIEPIVRRMY